MAFRRPSAPILSTSRLTLRPYAASDFSAVHAYGSDPEVSRHMAWGPNDEAMTHSFLRSAIAAARHPDSGGYFYGIVLTASQTLIGGCNLSYTNIAEREGMIGYALHRDHWRRGYTTEAACALLRLGFTHCSMHRIRSWCTPENTGSWRVMEKIGMRREGHEREAVRIRGEWRDWLQYAILDWEWRHLAESAP